jgi:hypothetical protein
VAIGAIWPERNDDMRLDLAHMCGDGGCSFSWVGLIQVAIYIVQQRDLPDAQCLCGGLEFCGAQGAKHVWAWIWAGGVRPPALTARRREQVGRHAFGGVCCQRAASAEGLVVRVGQHTQ